MMQKVNIVMGSNETWHWTHGLRCWENQHRLSSLRIIFSVYVPTNVVDDPIHGVRNLQKELHT